MFKKSSNVILNLKIRKIGRWYINDSQWEPLKNLTMAEDRVNIMHKEDEIDLEVSQEEKTN